MELVCGSWNSWYSWISQISWIFVVKKVVRGLCSQISRNSWISWISRTTHGGRVWFTKFVNHTRGSCVVREFHEPHTCGLRISWTTHGGSCGSWFFKPPLCGSRNLSNSWTLHHVIHPLMPSCLNYGTSRGRVCLARKTSTARLSRLQWPMSQL